MTPEKKRRIKEFIIGELMVVGTIVLALFMGYNIGQVDVPDGYTLVKDVIYRDGVVTMEPHVLKHLNDVWISASREKIEYGVCLKMNGTHVYDYNDNIIIGQSNQIMWNDTRCADGEIHTHFDAGFMTKGLCRLSPLDAIHFNSYNKAGFFDYMFIICGVNRIGVYTIDEMQLSHRIKVDGIDIQAIEVY